MVMGRLPRAARLYVSFGIIAAIVLISLSVIGYGVYQVLFDPAALFRRDFPAAGEVEKYFGQRVINIAVLGLSPQSYRSPDKEAYSIDTVMVASINFDTNTVKLISMPRDTYVEIAHLGIRDKISRSYLYGYNYGGRGSHREGLRYVVDTAALALGGVRLHHYVAMDMDGLMQLIDALGGVEFEVDLIVPGPTPAEDLYVGPQLLDGRGFLSYLTYREPGETDDLHRIERQKNLLLATFNHFKEAGRFRGVLHTYQVYREHVQTSLTFNQVAALLVLAGERVEVDSIFTRSLKGESYEYDGEHYIILDQRARAELVREVFGIEVKIEDQTFIPPANP